MERSHRLHALDGLRALALLLGIALHSSMSFIPGMPPGAWSTVDDASSPGLSVLFFVTHAFRMTLFFFIAGYFARLLVQRRGVAGFWRNRLLRIGVPMVVGWLLLYPVIEVIWDHGLREYSRGRDSMVQAAPGLPRVEFPVTHLWFLYYLLMLYVLLMLLRSLLRSLDRSGSMAAAIQRLMLGLLGTGFAPVVLAVPTAVVLSADPEWVLWAGVPTPNYTLVPQLAPVIAYGTAIAFGWLVHRAGHAMELLARRTPIHAVAAVLALVLCESAAGVRVGGTPAPGALHAFQAWAYCFAGWSTALALIGLGLRCLNQENRVVRYFSDASYWLYLVHLPVAAGLAVLVRHWPLPPLAKFLFILVVTLTSLLCVYQLFVRHTFVGQLLNGRSPAPRTAGAAQDSLQIPDKPDGIPASISRR